MDGVEKDKDSWLQHSQAASKYEKLFDAIQMGLLDGITGSNSGDLTTSSKEILVKPQLLLKFTFSKLATCFKKIDSLRSAGRCRK